MLKEYAYTGDVKELKSIGYTFQKLFANNYKAYHKKPVYMYVISGMVLEINNVEANHQEALVKFILDNKDKGQVFWEEDRSAGRMEFKNMPAYMLSNHGNVVNHDQELELQAPIWDERHKLMKLGKAGKISQDEEEKRLRATYKKECGSDSFLITWEFVQQILELNKLARLEVF